MYRWESRTFPRVPVRCVIRSEKRKDLIRISELPSTCLFNVQNDLSYFLLFKSVGLCTTASTLSSSLLLSERMIVLKVVCLVQVCWYRTCASYTTLRLLIICSYSMFLWTRKNATITGYLSLTLLWPFVYLHRFICSVMLVINESTCYLTFWLGVGLKRISVSTTITDVIQSSSS